MRCSTRYLIPDKQLSRLKTFLDPLAAQVEEPEYVAKDPVLFMHQFDEAGDQNLAGFFSALMAWGRRDIVIAKTGDLLERFGTGPADFIGNMSPADETRLEGFKHRTFTSEDVVWILRGLSKVLQNYGSLEAFWSDCYRYANENRATTQNERGSLISASTTNPVKLAGYTHADGRKTGSKCYNVSLSSHFLSVFHDRFFQLVPGAPQRVRKHIASPAKNSTCKRLWLYLRWTIRRESCVDPGTMHFMPPSELMIPLDVHVARYSRMLGLLTRRTNDWKSVSELTATLRLMDPEDPVKYDYALFGLGIGARSIPEELVLNPSWRVA